MDGIIIIDKPKGITSHDVVSKIRKIYHTKKVGHTGTLDPSATGVLPILIGNATKLSKYLIEHDKTYIATIKLGEETDTLDTEGKVIKQNQVNEKLITENNIENVLKSFVGEQMQTPPMYSAIKINGKKLYEYAREGQKVDIEPRKIKIYEISLKNINIQEKEIVIKVKCSKGTYIRMLCKDIAEKLETVGYMKELRRTKVNKFTLEGSVTLEELEKNKENVEYLESKIISIESIFKENESITLNNIKLKHLLNGVRLTYNRPNGIYRIYDERRNFQGIATIENNLLKRDVMN